MSTHKYSCKHAEVDHVQEIHRGAHASSGGQDGDLRGSFSFEVRICFCSFWRPWARNGGWPQSISYSRMPMLHQSTALPWPFPATISGAMYCTEYTRVREQVDHFSFIVNLSQ